MKIIWNRFFALNKPLAVLLKHLCYCYSLTLSLVNSRLNETADK